MMCVSNKHKKRLPVKPIFWDLIAVKKMHFVDKPNLLLVQIVNPNLPIVNFQVYSVLALLIIPTSITDIKVPFYWTNTKSLNYTENLRLLNHTTINHRIRNSQNAFNPHRNHRENYQQLIKPPIKLNLTTFRKTTHINEIIN